MVGYPLLFLPLAITSIAITVSAITKIMSPLIYFYQNFTLNMKELTCFFTLFFLYACSSRKKKRRYPFSCSSTWKLALFLKTFWVIFSWFSCPLFQAKTRVSYFFLHVSEDRVMESSYQKGMRYEMRTWKFYSLFDFSFLSIKTHKKSNLEIFWPFYTTYLII